MNPTHSFESLFQSLKDARDEHRILAATLVPDLAFIGLVDDVIDATESALELMLSERPHRTYMAVRVAFEAVQRLLVLAAAPDYIRMGTRAWLYYQSKDARFLPPQPSVARPSPDHEVIRIWADCFPHAAVIVAEEREGLAKSRGPDNFVGRNLAQCAEESYARLAEFRGSRRDPKTAPVDQLLYSFLCRDSHACLRLSPRAISINQRTGEVTVLHQPRDSAVIRRGAFRALRSCLRDALIAVQFRITQRSAEQGPRRLERADEEGAPGVVRPADLGLELSRKGVSDTPITFPGVPVYVVAELPDGALSCNVTDNDPPHGHVATFDFRGPQREALLRRLRQSRGVDERSFGQPLRIELDEPLVVTLTVTLGKLQRMEEDEFIPFNVLTIE